MDYQTHIIQSKMIDRKKPVYNSFNKDDVIPKYVSGEGWRIYNEKEKKFVSPIMSFKTIEEILKKEGDVIAKPIEKKTKSLLDFGYTISENLETDTK